MKVLTFGWISVFISMILMNIYIWTGYWGTPFATYRVTKVWTYLAVHLTLVALTVAYFYLFFNGKTHKRGTKKLSKVSSFYISFLHYSTVFSLIYDILLLIGRVVDYPKFLLDFLSVLFFGGFLIFGTMMVLSLYSLYNSKKVEVKEYNLRLKKMKSKLEFLNIVYISDGHIGTSLNIDNIDKLTSQIEELQPDILLLGGDFFDEGTLIIHKKAVTKKLAQIPTKYGVFAIEGNHEYKSDMGNIDVEMGYFSDAGIRVLRDEVVNIDDSFYLIGRRDNTVNRDSLEELLGKINRNYPVILLDHKPKFEEAMKYDKIQLQISGHTHAGQFLPAKVFNRPLKRFFKTYTYGYHKVAKLHHIVSSGVGNWGVSNRLGSRREIVNIFIMFK